jgi:hypothetical protein
MAGYTGFGSFHSDNIEVLLRQEAGADRFSQDRTIVDIMFGMVLMEGEGAATAGAVATASHRTHHGPRHLARRDARARAWRHMSYTHSSVRKWRWSLGVL